MIVLNDPGCTMFPILEIVPYIYLYSNNYMCIIESSLWISVGHRYINYTRNQGTWRHSSASFTKELKTHRNGIDDCRL